MSLGIHLGSEFLVVFVDDIACFWVIYHCHGLNWESEYLLQAQLVEPSHEHTLQGVYSLPFGTCAIGVAEVAEQRLEVRMVIIADVGKGRLIAAVTGRLVDTPYKLLEGLDDVVTYGTLLQTAVGSGDIVQMIVPIGTELAYNVVVQYNEVLAKGHSTLTL